MEQSVATISKSGPYDQTSTTPTRMVVYEIPYTVYIIASALVSMFCCPLIGVPGIFVSLEVTFFL
ncbi:hypothetical protein HOLleu_02792 [Holothuria leucospilota]|uniref:Transmembrane protein n=1 Tax=Holothuria leucospilota TaxID=206669 RepID=A0A9Q1CRS9_HOLLE|nr:hypothetical protein HOLleu_02792 [Holothuria leucospilota]